MRVLVELQVGHNILQQGTALQHVDVSIYVVGVIGLNNRISRFDQGRGVFLNLNRRRRLIDGFGAIDLECCDRRSDYYDDQDEEPALANGSPYLLKIDLP